MFNHILTRRMFRISWSILLCVSLCSRWADNSFLKCLLLLMLRRAPFLLSCSSTSEKILILLPLLIFFQRDRWPPICRWIPFSYQEVCCLWYASPLHHITWVWGRLQVVALQLIQFFNELHLCKIMDALQLFLWHTAVRAWFGWGEFELLKNGMQMRSLLVSMLLLRSNAVFCPFHCTFVGAQ